MGAGGGRGGYCNIRRVGGWWARGRGRGGGLGQGAGGGFVWLAGLVSCGERDERKEEEGIRVRRETYRLTLLNQIEELERERWFPG